MTAFSAAAWREENGLVDDADLAFAFVSGAEAALVDPNLVELWRVCFVGVAGKAPSSSTVALVTEDIERELADASRRLSAAPSNLGECGLPEPLVAEGRQEPWQRDESR